MKNLTAVNFQHYAAGFLDGAGSIDAEIVQRKDYTLGFQIHFTIAFFQKTSRHWFIIWLDKRLKVGTIKKRNDGLSEYIISGIQSVKKILLWLLPALQVKKPQARLLLSIIEKQARNQSKEDFISCSEMVDRIGDLNGVKSRVVNACTVKELLRKNSFLTPFPVETSNE